MSSTSISITPKALLDTTVLCGALLTNGVNRQILYSAQLGSYQPVISNVCLLEFIRNAAEGIGNRNKKKVFDWETIDSFLNQFVFPALQNEEVTNSAVSPVIVTKSLKCLQKCLRFRLEMPSSRFPPVQQTKHKILSINMICNFH